ncbi:hypothetical protein N431DRAFT_216004 [Stipitochalara longipes BDJ]|nr:hypothetical protein N431DRAFT_216004 [Stipitochalara longipes BDJ]
MIECAPSAVRLLRISYPWQFHSSCFQDEFFCQRKSEHTVHGGKGAPPRARLPRQPSSQSKARSRALLLTYEGLCKLGPLLLLLSGVALWTASPFQAADQSLASRESRGSLDWGSLTALPSVTLRFGKAGKKICGRQMSCTRVLRGCVHQV